MSGKSLWGNEEIQDLLCSRKLETIFPPLKSHLCSGANILDVGCGPGTITVDVANEVNPGSVFGIDKEPSDIEQGMVLAKRMQVENVTFKVGDVYCLDFADSTFDITYSHALFEWLREPVKALKEQKRITKKGGCVIAGIGNIGAHIMYPFCSCETCIASLSHLNDPTDKEIYFHSTVSRESFALFSEAGFQDIKIDGYVPPSYVSFSGSEYFDTQYQMLRVLLNLEGPLAQLLRKLIKSDVLDEATVLAAQREIEEWHEHPNALYTNMEVLAVGKIT